VAALAAFAARAGPAAAAPRVCATRLELAAAAERAGDAAAARAHVAEALARDPACADAHARLERLSGPAPPEPAPTELGAALRLAVAHPYDPRALVAAARSAAAADRRDLALPLAEKVVWLGDAAPGETAEVLRLLAALEAPHPLRAVPVHVYADAAARGEEGWRFRLRTLWSEVSASLAPLLGSRFVVLSIEPFDAPGAGADLAASFSGLAAMAAPEHGIVAGVLGAAPAGAAAGPDAHRGAAELLGRRLLVRLEPGAAGTRLLAHEILHLYGAVHVPEARESLMNPSGDSQRLDAENRRIAGLTRERSFGPGGVERNVLPRLDRGAAIDAWGAALRLDLRLRGTELARAVAASALAPGAPAPDPHLGDVARFVGALLVAEERRDEAALLFETAAALHGSRSEAGRSDAERANALRR
jgi:hypothetical protein